MISAYQLAASQPWLIQREALETVLSVAQRYGDAEALETKLGRPLDNARTVTMRDGVAVIPVTGPIFRYANLFTAISGATSTQVLATDIQAALDNPYVKAIVLDFDTPGGVATSINELAEQIAAGRERKPIKAYVGGAAASAGYWLASATGEIVVSETALLGSIGVLMSYIDSRERDAKAGLKQVDIVSSQSPDKRIDPDTDEGRAKVQAMVDGLATVFVDAVARNRSVTAETVMADFGRGGVLLGQQAIKAGMADRIGSLESVIAELAGSASNSTRNKPMGNTKGQVTVSSTDDLRNALAAGHTADQITIASNEQAVAAARAAGVEDGKQTATDTAVAAERTRIADIQALARKGFESQAQAAINNGDSPEAFAMTVLKAAKDRGITLDAIGQDAPAAAAHSRPTDDSGKPAATLNTRDVYARRAQASSNKGATL
ncbi:S49 family peptidase [Stenotrophomonas terrae]|uniref:S49 family peptidase n=1 Tax=Stenotrophomonas terrae TaxID=405446 RepID=UPI0032085A21